MNIHIENADNVAIDLKVLQACLARCAVYASNECLSVDIVIAERTPMSAPLHRGPGMLVYRMKRVDKNSCVAYIEAVSQKPHLSVEFH